MEELIKSFLTIGYGDGYGDGSGYGSGYGSGDGSGSGSGYGSGDGSGYGSGDGYGYGDGSGYGDGYAHGDGCGSGSGSGSGYGYGSGYGDLLSIKKVGDDNIYDIDGVPTAIDNIKGNIAKGRVLQADMTWEPCYIVRIGNSFAHGETIHDAQRDAQQKHMKSAPIEERLNMFKDRFPDFDEPVPAKDLFDWHNTLTGSCMMGRKQWCKDHGINVDADTFTVKEFIELTKDSYGGETIRKLIGLYKPS